MGRETDGTQNRPIVIDDPAMKPRKKHSRKNDADMIHIDLTAFDEANDPVLERELAQIAMGGRVNTFSTAASDQSRDLENGRGRYADDMADRPSYKNPAYKRRQPSNWRGTLSKLKPSRQNQTMKWASRYHFALQQLQEIFGCIFPWKESLIVRMRLGAWNRRKRPSSSR